MGCSSSNKGNNCSPSTYRNDDFVINFKQGHKQHNCVKSLINNSASPNKICLIIVRLSLVSFSKASNPHSKPWRP